VIISHGLCSSGSFYIINILCVSNFSYPFSLNFIGEIVIIMVFLR